MKNLFTIVLFFITLMICAQEESESTGVVQDDESKALDATATQWSFQLAYQDMPRYYNDLVNGAPRRPGLDNYLQLRIVAPIPLKGLTILPRLTVRHYEDLSNNKTGFGNTELFALIIPKGTVYDLRFLVEFVL